MDDLKAEGYFAGQELPGKVAVIETIKPFSEKNPNQMKGNYISNIIPSRN